MISLRPYQQASIDATFDYWRGGGGNPLIDLATGTGKSLVVARIIQDVMQMAPGARVLMLVHVRELVRQNVEQLLRIWPGAPVGINSAGLGRRDVRSPIICASIQSVYQYAHALGARDLIIVDEAHLVPKKSDGMYKQLFADMQSLNPDLRICGLTATPFRMDSGRLDRGEDRLFDKTVYSYGIGQGIRDGYLSPLVSKGMVAEIDVSSVARRGGEFIAGALEAAADVDAITQSAVNEMMAYGANRRSWLVFCSGVTHAEHVRNAIRSRGISCETVTGKTPKDERDRILNALKSGKLRAVTNMSVLTTGFDAPGIDMIAMLRPTLSTGLYVQMLGRGTRLAPSKADCLVLDFSGNVRRHGPVDDLDLEQSGGGTRASGPKDDIIAVAVGDVRSTACPYCRSMISPRAFVCPECNEQVKEPHEARADVTPILSGMNGPDDWRDVTAVAVKRHASSFDKPPTMQVTYHCGRKTFREWLCFSHAMNSFPRKKAERWWRDRGCAMPFPKDVDDAILRFDAECEPIMGIRVKKDGDYDRVIAWRQKEPDLLERAKA